MDKISDISLENTVTVKVDCLVNSQVIGNNFKIIIDCLKDLKSAQDGYDGRLNKFEDRLSLAQKNLKETNNNNNTSGQQQNNNLSQKQNANQNEGISETDKDNLMKMIKQIGERTENNEKNILDNIKDINLLNKDVIGIKEELQKLKTLASNVNNNDGNGKGKGGLDLGAESINNINKQMMRNREQTEKIKEQLDKLNKQVSSLKDKLDQFIKDSMFTEKETDKQSISNNNNNTGGGDISRAEFNELKQKVGILQKKTSVLQMTTDDLGKEQKNLSQSDQEIRKDIEELKKIIQNLRSEMSNKNGNADGVSKNDLQSLQKLIDQLRKDLEALKKQHNTQSKTSIEDDSGSKGRFDKASFTQAKFRDDDKLKELISRVDYLEKMMGSKNSIDHQGKHEKLPLIKRPKPRQSSVHEKSSVKRDMHEIKNELQAWLNNYLAGMKSKDNFEDLELKIQQIKNALGKKADQEGMKKGLMFLESKINQLYLFLTEPDGQDAMIVRKGFNCLSCSKKVEKLRGKLGPHLNWNNMTATNYSPPKVGYSRHQGDSPEREDDL